jgi:hypothetical protein
MNYPDVLITFVNKPMIVALMFGFAGAVFVGIFLLRYWRARRAAGQTTKIV